MNVKVTHTSSQMTGHAKVKAAHASLTLSPCVCAFPHSLHVT